MNGLEIIETVSKDEIVFRCFGGLMSIDKLNIRADSKRIFFICNTDLWKNAGKHWVVIYFKEGNANFFDPLGKEPDWSFFNFMKKYSKTIFFNEIRVQPEGSMSCGEYCIVFASLMSHDESFQNILKYMKNDTYVIDYVNEMKNW